MFYIEQRLIFVIMWEKSDWFSSFIQVVFFFFSSSSRPSWSALFEIGALFVLYFVLVVLIRRVGHLLG